MDTVLGLIGVAIWIVCIIGLAASVTWAVVKIFPTDKPAARSESQEAS